MNLEGGEVGLAGTVQLFLNDFEIQFEACNGFVVRSVADFNGRNFDQDTDVPVAGPFGIGRRCGSKKRHEEDRTGVNTGPNVASALKRANPPRALERPCRAWPGL